MLTSPSRSHQCSVFVFFGIHLLVRQTSLLCFPDRLVPVMHREGSRRGDSQLVVERTECLYGPVSACDACIHPRRYTTDLERVGPESSLEISQPLDIVDSFEWRIGMLLLGSALRWRISLGLR